MASSLLATGLAALEFSRKVTLGLAEDIPDGKFLHQPFPGANHALWVLGHLACTDEFFLNKVGGKPGRRFDKWSGIFFMGSKPTPNAVDYPPISEVRLALDEGRGRLVEWFKSLGDSELMMPLPDELKNFAPSRAALMSTIAWHEGLHAGQLSVCRKSLGLQPKFG